MGICKLAEGHEHESIVYSFKQKHLDYMYSIVYRWAVVTFILFETRHILRETEGIL